MADIEVGGLTNKATPEGTDEVEIQETGSGTSKKTTFAAIISALVSGVYQPLASVLTNTTASFLTAQETKINHISVTQAVDLDTIESDTSTNNAKATCDTTNVTAAGALMDSEVDADLKTFALPASTTISAFGATLVDDADAATGRATLGAMAKQTLTDNAIPKANLTAGEIQDSGVIIDDSNNVSGAVTFGLTGDVKFTERADHASTPSAGEGYLWTKNTTPSTMIFTDDAGTDTTLGAGGGGTPGGADTQFQINDSSSFGGGNLWNGTNEVAQRNSTNAQTFNLYNTYTDASNYERGFAKWNTNVIEFGAEALGTGTTRNVGIITGGTLSVGTAADTDKYLYINDAGTSSVVQIGRDSSAAGANGSIAIGKSAVSTGGGITIGQGSTGSSLGAVVVGLGASANSIYAVALGPASLANRYSQVSFPRAFGTHSRKSNRGFIVGLTQTTDTSATVFTDVAGGNYPFDIPSDHTITFKGIVTAQKDDQTENAGWKVEGVIKNDSGTTTLIASSVTEIGSDNSSAWTLAMAADDTNDVLQMSLTAEATVNATASLHFVEQASANL